MIYFLLLIAWGVLTALIWRYTDRLARRLRRRVVSLIVRGLLAAFYLPILLYLLVPFSRPFFDSEPTPPTNLWPMVAYIWYPAVLQGMLLVLAPWLIARVWRQRKKAATKGAKPPAELPVKAQPSTNLSRREAMVLALSAVPPVATIGLSAAAVMQYGTFSVRRESVYLPTLPDDLDGVTIAHITDLHAGHFFDSAAAGRLADAVNALKADLVVFTGDLIDRGLLDRLPIGMQFLSNLDRRYGFAMIEGNHDLHVDAPAFENAVRSAGMPLLLDDALTFTIPGRRTPVQLLGVSWGELSTEDDLESIDPPPRWRREWTKEWMESSVVRVAALRQADAFPILLAHHPHTVDAAAIAGFPLVLAGHTHGGQLMLTETIGAGPLRFKYWRGEYQVGSSKLVICNGAGSWFPLRVNAQAEVLHLTLTKK